MGELEGAFAGFDDPHHVLWCSPANVGTC
jgi:hypothetical protein